MCYANAFKFNILSYNYPILFSPIIDIDRYILTVYIDRLMVKINSIETQIHSVTSLPIIRYCAHYGSSKIEISLAFTFALLNILLATSQQMSLALKLRKKYAK